ADVAGALCRRRHSLRFLRANAWPADGCGRGGTGDKFVNCLDGACGSTMRQGGVDPEARVMMTRLQVLELDRSAPRTDVTLRSGPNWTAVLFFAALGMLHLYMATSAFVHHRWEGFMSLVLG